MWIMLPMHQRPIKEGYPVRKFVRRHFAIACLRPKASEFWVEWLCVTKKQGKDCPKVVDIRLAMPVP